MHCIPGQFINPACIQIHHMHQQIPKHHSSQLLLCDGAHLNFRPRLCVYEQVPCLFLPEHYQLSSSWQCCDGLPLQLYRDAHDFMCISLTCVVLTAIGVVDDHWCWRPLVLTTTGSCLRNQAARVCLPHMMVVALSTDSRWQLFVNKWHPGRQCRWWVSTGFAQRPDNDHQAKSIKEHTRTGSLSPFSFLSPVQIF